MLLWVNRKVGDAFNTSMGIQYTSSGERLLIFSQLSFYFLWQLEPGYTPVMILLVSIPSAKRKIEICPLNSVSEKEQLSLMITELSIAKTCTFLLSFVSFLYRKERWDKVVRFFWGRNFRNSAPGNRKTKCYQKYPINIQKSERRSSSHPSRNEVKRQDQGQQYFLTRNFLGILSQRKQQSKSWMESVMKKWTNHLLSGTEILKVLYVKKNALYLKREMTFTFLMDTALWGN